MNSVGNPSGASNRRTGHRTGAIPNARHLAMYATLYRLGEGHCTGHDRHECEPGYACSL
jgi:hypothetical protein